MSDCAQAREACMATSSTKCIEVENVNLNKKVDAAQVMNQFVNGATDGMMKNVVNADGISDDVRADVSVFIIKLKCKKIFRRN